MNKEKSKLKILWDTEWGNKFDDMREGAERELNECRGGQNALKGAIVGLSSLHEFIDRDLEMVESDTVPEDTKRPLPRDQEAALYAKSYLIRSIKALENLLERATKQEMIANGRASMATDMVNAASKSISLERGRVDLVEAAEKAGVAEQDIGRDAGALSAAEDIQQRREAAKAVKAAKAAATALAEKADSGKEPEAVIAVEETVSKSSPKKRRRKHKATNGVKEPTVNGQNPG